MTIGIAGKPLKEKHYFHGHSEMAGGYILVFFVCSFLSVCVLKTRPVKIMLYYLLSRGCSFLLCDHGCTYNENLLCMLEEISKEMTNWSSLKEQINLKIK